MNQRPPKIFGRILLHCAFVKFLYCSCIFVLLCEYHRGCRAELSTSNIFAAKASSINRSSLKQLRNSDFASNRGRSIVDGFFWSSINANLFKLKKNGHEVSYPSEVNIKQNYHHNEASPTALSSFFEPLALTMTNASANDSRNTSLKTYFLDNKPFELGNSKSNNRTHRHRSPPAKTSTSTPSSHMLTLTLKNVSDAKSESTVMSPVGTSEMTPVGDKNKSEEEIEVVFPFANPLTLRIGAFFEAPDLGVLSAKFLSSLQGELKFMQVTFEKRLLESDQEASDEDANGNSDYKKNEDLKRRSSSWNSASVFGNVIIEGLAMEMPTLEPQQITRTCETLMQKNVVASIALGNPKNVYGASILSQTTLSPLVTGTFSRYSDEEEYKVE